MGLDISDIRREIEDDVKTRARIATSKIADELTQEAEFQMIKFYAGYSPVKYRNQFGMLGAYQRYYRNPHNRIYYGGVEITKSNGSYHANYKPGHPSVSPEYIAELTLSGRHGATECFPASVLARIHTFPPVMSPSPDEALQRKVEEIGNNINIYFN